MAENTPPSAGSITCLCCGATAPAGARFCGACGAPLGEPICRSCGAKLAAEARFCGACGAPVAQAPTASPSPASIPSAPPPSPAAPGPSAPPPVGQSLPPAKPRRTGCIVAVVVVALLGLLLVCLLAVTLGTGWLKLDISSLEPARLALRALRL